MKIILNKRFLSSAVTESAEIYSALDLNAGNRIAALAPIASDLIRAEFTNLKHFSSEETEDEIVLVISDEVLIKLIRMYANISKLVMPVVTSVCALFGAFLPAFKNELKAYETFAMEPKVKLEETTAQ